MKHGNIAQDRSNVQETDIETIIYCEQASISEWLVVTHSKVHYQCLPRVPRTVSAHNYGKYSIYFPRMVKAKRTLYSS